MSGEYTGGKVNPAQVIEAITVTANAAGQIANLVSVTIDAVKLLGPVASGLVRLSGNTATFISDLMSKTKLNENPKGAAVINYVKSIGSTLEMVGKAKETLLEAKGQPVAENPEVQQALADNNMSSVDDAITKATNVITEGNAAIANIKSAAQEVSTTVKHSSISTAVDNSTPSALTTPPPLPARSSKPTTGAHDGGALDIESMIVGGGTVASLVSMDTAMMILVIIFFLAVFSYYTAGSGTENSDKWFYTAIGSGVAIGIMSLVKSNGA